MAKKIVKRRKIRLFNFLLVLLVLLGLFFAVYQIIEMPIKNIIIKNTTYLNDDYIIELAKIKDYPSFVLTSYKSISKNVSKSKYISSVKVNKKWGFVLVIDVLENRPLFYSVNDNRYILSNNISVEDDSISNNFRVPRLLNYIPDKKYKKFVSDMEKINLDTLSKISDIEYKPNDYDKDRFLLYMDDGNMVYLTLTKFKMINHYNEVLTQLENHKGILYLDSGNHFKIME